MSPASENTDAAETVDRICLEVFAAVSASVTHEVKNILSVVNENAGLVQDMVETAEEDDGIPASIAGSSMKTIGRQVTRCDRLMKAFNEYAHGGDRGTEHVDLGASLNRMILLTRRQADQRQVQASASCESDICFTRPRLRFESLIYLALMQGYGRVKPGKELKLIGRADKQAVEIRFEADGPPDPDRKDDKGESVLLSALGATAEELPDGWLIRISPDAAPEG